MVRKRAAFVASMLLVSTLLNVEQSFAQTAVPPAAAPGAQPAQPGPEAPDENVASALAETLYRQARELMAAGNYDQACPKFQESYRVEPATGTLLNLAACHEGQGKFASAWLEYADALRAARREKRQSRIRFAEQRLSELEPKLSRLTLVVPPATDRPGLELELDGIRIGRAGWGVPTPVDPGLHHVEAIAPGHETLRLAVEVGANADQQSVTVPPLVALPAAAPAVVAPVAKAPSETPSGAPHDAGPLRPIPTSVYVAGGVTAALGTAAIVTGIVYLDRRGSYDDDRNDESRYDAAHSLGVANLVLWIATGVGAGVTTYLYVTRPAEQRPSPALALAPWIVPNGAGAVLSGSLGEF